MFSQCLCMFNLHTDLELVEGITLLYLHALPLLPPLIHDVLKV